MLHEKMTKAIVLRGTVRTGFTLIELVVVITLIGILVGIGIPYYKSAVKRGQEATLKENLFLMRELIQKYYVDKKQYPQTLQALVDDGYLMKIPVDPIMKSADTWEIILDVPSEDDMLTGVIPGVADIRSGSKDIALDGTPYSTW